MAQTMGVHASIVVHTEVVNAAFLSGRMLLSFSKQECIVQESL